MASGRKQIRTKIEHSRIIGKIIKARPARRRQKSVMLHG